MKANTSFSKTFLFLFVSLLLTVISQAQGFYDMYSSHDKEQHRKIALKMVAFLEANQPDSVIARLDTTFIRTHPQIRQQLKKLATTIHKNYKIAERTQSTAILIQQDYDMFHFKYLVPVGVAAELSIYTPLINEGPYLRKIIIGEDQEMIEAKKK